MINVFLFLFCFLVVGILYIHYPSVIVQGQQIPAFPGTSSSIASTNDTTNPFGDAYEGPPEIVMVYNNTEYRGALDSYSFSKTNTLRNLPMFNDTITSTLPTKAVIVERGSTVSFAIKGNAPPEAQSDTLAVNAYTINGKPVKVLNVASDDESQKTFFGVDLEDEGKEYILMAIAMWLPEENTENISGYISYSFRINMLNNK